MAKKPITTLESNADSFLPDNTTRLISASDVRNRIHEIIEWLSDLGGVWYTTNTENDPPSPGVSIYRNQGLAIGGMYADNDADYDDGTIFLGAREHEMKVILYDGGAGARGGLGHLNASGGNPARMNFSVHANDVAHVFKVRASGQERLRLLNNYARFTGFGAGSRDDSIAPNSFEINNIAYFGPMGELSQAPITKLPGSASASAQIFDGSLASPGNPTVADVEAFIGSAELKGPTYVYYVGSGSVDEPQALFVVDSNGNAKKTPATGPAVDGLVFQGDYNPTTDTPDLTDAGGSEGDYYEVTKPVTEQVVDFGSGDITFPANTGGRLIHDGTKFLHYPGQVPSASLEEVVNRNPGQVAQLGYINQYTNGHTFNKATEAPAFAANRAFSVKIDGVTTLWSPNSAGDDWEPNSVATRPVLTTSSAHGLDSSDVGKPLASDGSIWDETKNEPSLLGVITSVPSTTTLTYAVRGEHINIDRDLLTGESTWDVDDEDEGRFLDWDASAGKYVGLPPVDAGIAAPQVLHINRLDASTINCTVLV